MAQSGHNTGGISVSILHDDSNTGVSWKSFIESLFLDSLPEEYKDLDVDMASESLNNIDEDRLAELKYSQWRLLLLTAEMVGMLNSPQCIINQSNIMQSETGGLVVLLVGNNDDLNYQKKALGCLHVFPDFFDFELVRVKNTEQIFQDILGIISPINIAPHPNTISFEDSQQCITFLSNKPYKRKNNTQYIFEFINSNEEKKSIHGVFYNPYTMIVENPGHTAGTLVVKAYECIVDEENTEVSRTQIGNDMKISLQSELDKFSSILERQDCVEFLKQALQISTNDKEEALDILDKELLESIKRNVPSNKLGIVFGNDQGLATEQDIRSDQYVPTLLHFSAMYGLREVTSFLLKCPGSLRAFGTANYDGDYPTTLAEKSGHWDLKEFMSNFMHVSAMVDDEYGGKNKTPEIMSKLVSGKYIITSQREIVAEGAKDYGPTDNSAYIPMRGLNSHLIIPIDEEDELYSKIITKYLEGSESLYETLTHPMPDLSVEKPLRQRYSPTPLKDLDVTKELAPPLPPSRESRSRTENRISSYNDIAIPNVPSMSSPAQQELINLQTKVKNNELTINQAILRFKEWEKNHKERAASFQYQQERLQKIRNSITRRQVEKEAQGIKSPFPISQPMSVGSSTYGRILEITKNAVPNQYGEVEHRNPGQRNPRRDIDMHASRDDLSSLYGSSTVFHQKMGKQTLESSGPPLPPRDDAYGTMRPPPRDYR